MVHIRWATYNARTLGALEAPQAIPPLKGVCGEGWVWREDSENSAAQYVRASNSPSVFSFLLSSYRASFLRIAHSPPLLSSPSSFSTSFYLSIHTSIHLSCSNQATVVSVSSVDLLRYTLSPSTNTTLCTTAIVRAARRTIRPIEHRQRRHQEA